MFCVLDVLLGFRVFLDLVLFIWVYEWFLFVLLRLRVDCVCGFWDFGELLMIVSIVCAGF